MSVQKQVLDAVVAKIAALTPFATPVIGALPASNSISVAVSAGSITEQTLSHGCKYSMDMVVNGKHSDQSVVYDGLCAIHEALNKASDYPSGVGWCVVEISTSSLPTYIGRDELQWLYGSGITVVYCVV